VIGRARLHLGSWSTFGQTALLVIAALAAAQLFAFLLTRNIIDQWRNASLVDPAVQRFVVIAEKIATLPAGQRPAIVAALQHPDERFSLLPSEPSGPFTREGDGERSLIAALKGKAVPFAAVRVFHPRGFDRRPPEFSPPGQQGPPPRDMANRDGPGFAGLPPDHGGGEIALAAELPGGAWLIGRFRNAGPFPLLLQPLFLSQIALFIILLAATLFWASRLSRPLRKLAAAAEDLQPQDGFEPMSVEGPREVRVAIQSFNAMAARVRDLLAEKDRMLSAIGHDLRTPLASLRIRAESIEPEPERDKFVETLDEMTQMVEEILGLARLGHSTEPRQLVDLAALADSVVEEFRGLGKNAVFIEAPRTTVTMQVNQVRRLTRNLIDNAVKYGGVAEVSLRTGDGVALVIEDRGPGIPVARLGEVLQPFTRLDQSRSRLTGGIGLGLTIADAIAKAQGATLTLENRDGGGFRAIVKWPNPN
jgi:signal transduction histidine kinase